MSYQWEASRQPGDLDCLIGINFVQFRKANPSYTGLTNREISDELNEDFREHLQPETENWNGYELTFYALTTDDITDIRPYAAYDLKYNEWTVTPNPHQTAPVNPEWDKIVDRDFQMTHQIHQRYITSLQEVSGAHPGPTRRNAEARLAAAAQQGLSLYDEIHGNRGEAFSISGKGYGDFHNYRWQGGKRTGTVDMLREIKHHADRYQTHVQLSVYGAELPDSDTLVRRAATYRNN